MMSLSPHHPLLVAAEIDAALKPNSHPLNPDNVRHSACISDMVGMKGLGVHKIRLEPNVESTTIHYHLNGAEWFYILKGSATLLLIDASIPHHEGFKAFSDATWTSRNVEDAKEYQVEERQVGPGDFMGFQGGLTAGQYAHGLRAGPEGLEYLCGGTRDTFDVCCYPQKGITNMFESTSETTIWAPVEASKVPKDQEA
nr:uncharacterized protein CI109_006067 [Kwoniella shandongensis]KAA5525616.1 hypothetical protein CI109_006067 [Kwoniella shandongensis]